MKPLAEIAAAVVEVGLYALLLAASLHLWLQATWAKNEGPIDDEPEPEPEPDSEHPFITIQLPLRNEAPVVEALFQSVVALSWPRDRLEIQVLDDSEDETSPLLDRLTEQHRQEGAPIVLLRRADRRGYKAGNLAHGLASARGELIVVLDADAQPVPELLERLYTSLRKHPEHAFVQARWSFRNADASVLGTLQASTLDALFAIEQARLSDEKKPVQFNGTAGMWRRAALDQCGGWLPNKAEGSLTEDLDLSLRAEALRLRGCTLPEISVSTELPSDMASFVAQQVRWVRGGGLALRTFAHSATSSLAVRALMTIAGHLLRHARQPLLVAAAVRLTAIAWYRAHPVCPAWLGPIVLGIATFTMGRYLNAARRRIGAKTVSWLGPAMMALSMGLAPRLASAFIGGVLGRTGAGFVRTQKGGSNVTVRRWPTPIEWLVLVASAFAAVGFLEAQDVLGLLAAIFVSFSVLWVATS